MLYKIKEYALRPQSRLVAQIAEYYDYCQYTRNFTAATMHGKISSLNHFAHYVDIERLEDLDNKMIFDWIALQTERGNQPRTVNNRLKHLTAMLHYYMDEDMTIPGVNLRKIKKQIENSPNRRAFDRDKITEALRYADRDGWLMIKLSFDCGLRIGELQGIRLQDIDGNIINVLGKGRKRRLVIMSDEARVRLEDFIIRHKIKDYLWAIGRGGAVMSHTAMRKKMQKAFAAAGVEDFKPHELRHSYATDLKRLGASTRSIQQGLGHTSEKITEIYLHDLDTSSLRELYKLKYSAEISGLR